MLLLFARMSDQKKATINYSRNYFVLLYPDNEEHLGVLENIKKICDSFAYILHDKDTYVDTDDIKKAHYHVVIKYPNKRYRSAVAVDLGLEERFLKGCVLDSAMRYLLHVDDPDKYQYDISEVRGTLLPYLKKLLNRMGKDEGERVLDLLNYIDSTTTAIRISEFSKYCALNGYWDVYRRSAMIFKDYIREHNNSIFVQLRKQGWESLTEKDILDCITKCY